SYESSLREQLLRERLKNLEVPVQDKIIQAVNAPAKKRTKEQNELLKMHAGTTEVSADDIAKRFADFAALREQTKKSTAERAKERPKPLEKVSVFVETDANPPHHHVLKRGQHHKPGEEVEPGVPSA